jgi:hypothetical protein
VQGITAVGQNSTGDAVSMTTKLAAWLRSEDAECDWLQQARGCLVLPEYITNIITNNLTAMCSFDRQHFVHT